jgi:membrane-bound inhibitor of C-type lysozyme
VTKFTLINANTDLAISQLLSGATLTLALLPTRNLNVRADTSGSIKSVRFWLDGKMIRTENAAPWSLAGDANGNYAAWTPSLGNHTLVATPYTGSGATGTAGASLTVTFKVL